MASRAMRRVSWASVSRPSTYSSLAVSSPASWLVSSSSKPASTAASKPTYTRSASSNYPRRTYNSYNKTPSSSQSSSSPASSSSAAKTTSSTSSAPASSPSSSAPKDTSSPPAFTTTPTSHPIQNITKTGLADAPPDLVLEPANVPNDHVDWTRSYHGLSAEPFSKEAAAILLAPVEPDDVEIKPDGIVYLPEIKYRRILNKAFGPGGWGLVPRSESIVTGKTVTREYALVAHGRLVSVSRGEQDYFSPDGIPTATEGCKSNAMMRCCKDLGVASELWDPRWIRKFKANYAKDVFVEHMVSKKKSKIWIRKDDEVMYPWKKT
ncbi:mitochondrial genome maintenance protein [Trichophyton equinum CBS 127.97]|uniref:Mitochondrial genome maintenance protein MGM101 n=1 Tax=Trichophyton equinum (strain ATCC MYA-4606 / CBS 127.97) TaxID=559882 RepID=F2Q258_TRIEC|nr:mitochondrial genome maintenance protein [Trichophyton equinum CBS 127.97]